MTEIPLEAYSSRRSFQRADQLTPRRRQFVRFSHGREPGKRQRNRTDVAWRKDAPKSADQNYPFIFLLYIVAFLDRINIGFAALTMNKELGINSQQFGLLAGIFFLGYFVFEIPSNLLLHKIGARIWITRILIGWGIVAVLTGFVRNVSQLYLARFLFGLAEAGYFPGIVLYLTYWFPKREQARAIALFMAAIPVASILGAPVSGLILDHIHWFSISSWRWLLALEGFPAIVCGILVYFILPSRPTEATFLTTEEKSWITAELSCEQQEKTGGHSISPFRTLFLPRVWHVVLISFSFQLAGYIPLFWMPQAVRSLWSHYSNSVVGVLLAVPYVFGLAAMILVSRSSDRCLERRYHGANFNGCRRLRPDSAGRNHVTDSFDCTVGPSSHGELQRECSNLLASE